MNAALATADLLALLDCGEPVLLPNVRAAKALRTRFDERQRTRGLGAWEAPPVFAWAEWTASLWSSLNLEGLDDRVLLNGLQEESLWIEVISASGEGSSLTASAVRELARLARSGLDLASSHGVLDRLRTTADSPETKAFANWHAAFADHCQRRELIARAMVEGGLAEHASLRELALPVCLHLAGFDRLTPARKGLLHALRGIGVDTAFHDLARTPAGTEVRGSVCLPDPREELRWAVRWVRQQFEQGRDPVRTVALLLPDPASERGALEALLREVLAPELDAVTSDLSSTPWQFSSGPALATLPIVHDALLLLRWTVANLPLEEVGRLLLSPFLAHTEPLESRARFEMHGLRRATLLRPELGLAYLLRLANSHRHGLHLPELQAFHQLAGDPRALSGTGSHAEWTERIRRLLRRAGWPGGRTLSPAEFQAVEAWESVLDLLATLDVGGSRVDYHEILGILERELQRISAPEPAGNAPLQILRLTEAEGCLFDAAILLRTTDGSVPSPEPVHPFLSRVLQHSLGLPGTDPALALARAKEHLESLAERCGHLLLTHAVADENGPLRASSLIAELDLPSLDAEVLAPSPPSPDLLGADLVSDETALPPLPSRQVSGGARLLELQAACGFRAFAELRLGAGMPEGKAFGLDARESGSLLHHALEFFWTEVKSQANLKAFSADQRSAALGRAVTHAFSRLRERASEADHWTAAYLHVLERRLQSLLDRWLECELQRGPFTVLPPEQKQIIEVGPLELSIRPDRIDRVDGGFVLVDYKSSATLSTDDWLGDRPDAPQLPLYALLGDTDEFRALAFARVRPGKSMAWLSLADQPGIFPAKRGGALHDVAAQIELWRAELDRLAWNFAEGVTDIEPKTYPRTCQYCQQRLLCRVEASALLSNAPEHMASTTEMQDG